MKTIARYQPGFVAADTSKNVRQIPRGKMWLTLVTIEVVELDGQSTADMDNTEFAILAGLPSLIQEEGGEEATIRANLLRRACKQVVTHVQGNPEHFEPQ